MHGQEAQSRPADAEDDSLSQDRLPPSDDSKVHSSLSKGGRRQGMEDTAALHHPPSYSGGKGPGPMQHELDAQNMSDMTVLRELSTYLLPKDNTEYRWRIGTAMSLLVVSKLLNVSVSI